MLASFLVIATLAQAGPAGAPAPVHDPVGTTVHSHDAVNAPMHDVNPHIEIRVDSLRRQVVLTVGPVHVPAGGHDGHEGADTHLQFAWPVAGWVRGYGIEVLDADGRVLPRSMLHHAGVANLERRQLPYRLVERLFAAGAETSPVMLPSSMGLPLSRGQQMVVYFHLVNDTDRPLDGVVLRISLAWIPPGGREPRSVFPLFLNANAEYAATSAFDLPPGTYERSSEFTLPISGRLRGLGGHMHDYATEVRLEDVEKGKVLARLRAKRAPDGQLVSLGRTIFLFKPRGLRLTANRRYRVVGVYNNPTCETIPLGGMAHMAGPFTPDDLRSWPQVDPDDSLFQTDLASLVGNDATPPARTEMHDHAARSGKAEEPAQRNTIPCSSRTAGAAGSRSAPGSAQ